MAPAELPALSSGPAGATAGVEQRSIIGDQWQQCEQEIIAKINELIRALRR
jgi:hypothetical protein